MTRQLALAIVAGAIFAAGADAQTRPEPADPGAPAPPPGHASAFDGYRAYRDEPVASWREVNDAVREAGGHAGVLRAEQQVPAGSAPDAAHGTSGRMPAGAHNGKREQ